MNRKDKFWFSCIWIYPLSFALIWSVMFCLASIREIVGKTYHYNIPVMLLLALIPTMIGLMFNGIRYLFGKRDFDPFGKDTPTSKSKEKLEAMNPEVPSKYLKKQPEGFIIGKWKNRYVCLPNDGSNVTHTLLLGSPGSGKSSTLLNTVINNFNFVPEEKRMTVFCTDIKPELARKGTYLDSPFVKVVNPSSMDGHGFDVWHGLDQNSTDDQIIERNDMIARALIVNPGGDNAFFYNNAQNLLVPFLTYGFRKGSNFAESMLRVIHMPISDLIAQILSDQDIIKHHPKIVGMLKIFEGKEGETIESIELTLRENLRIFDTDTVVYQLGKNRRKATPEDLTNGISIFIALPDYLLYQYNAVFRLIIQTTLTYLSSIPEHERADKDVPLIWVLLDEFVSLNKIEIHKSLATLRSRKVTITICTQNISGLDSVYGHDGARQIIDNCETTLVLSMKDKASADVLSSWFGTYKEKMTARRRNSILGVSDPASENVSEQYRQILDVADIQRLRSEKKMLVFTDGDRFMIDRCAYFEIPKLLEKSNEIVKYNDEYESEEWFYIV